MNQLMTMTQAALLTMSSQEIADLVESRHDNVRRTIERLAERGVIALPPMEEKPTAGRPAVEYVFSGEQGKRDSIIVVAQLSPEFTARLVDRWQELEAQQSPAFAIPKTLPEALRLAAEQAEALERQQAQLEAARPKVEFVDRFVQSSSGSKGFREVCKLLKANEAEFRAFVMDHRIMYRLGGKLTAYQCHIDAGRFEVRAGVTESEHAYTTTKFTAKGVSWIAGEWAKYQVEQQVAA